MLEFRGLHVVVTGSGGALGSAVARLLEECGATLHLPVRSRGVDLTCEGSVRDFYAALPELWASIHCAGGFAMAPIAEAGLEELTELWSMNAVSSFLCCREAVRRMRRSGGGGRIVNVAARPALEARSGAGMSAYAATKAAVAALTESLGEELAQEGIWVNAVAPSILDTPRNREAMPDADASSWPKVEDVARTVTFLASPENRSTRGAIVPVYGRS